MKQSAEAAWEQAMKIQEWGASSHQFEDGG